MPKLISLVAYQDMLLGLGVDGTLYRVFVDRDYGYGGAVVDIRCEVVQRPTRPR